MESPFKRFHSLNHEAFGERWTKKNYRHAAHFGPYEPAGVDQGTHYALREGMTALEEYANGGVDYQALEEAADYFKAASGDDSLKDA
jgi:hypothetical protein